MPAAAPENDAVLEDDAAPQGVTLRIEPHGGASPVWRVLGLVGDGGALLFILTMLDAAQAHGMFSGGALLAWTALVLLLGVWGVWEIGKYGAVTLTAAPNQPLRLRHTVLFGCLSVRSEIALQDYDAVACMLTTHAANQEACTFRLEYVLVPRRQNTHAPCLLRSCKVVFPTRCYYASAQPPAAEFDDLILAALPPHLANISALARATGLADGGFIGCAEENVYYHHHRRPGQRDNYGRFPKGTLPPAP